jgi:hypothetical protein
MSWAQALGTLGGETEAPPPDSQDAAPSHRAPNYPIPTQFDKGEHDLLVSLKGVHCLLA